MATVEQILAAAERADQAGDAPAAKVLRDRAAEMQQGPSPDVIRAAAEKARAAGDQAAYDVLIARLPPAAPVASAGAGPATLARAEDVGSFPADMFAQFEAANPELKGAYTQDNFPKAGESVIDPRGGGGGRGGAPRFTVRQRLETDTLGETAGAMMEGPIAGVKAFAGGLMGGDSPTRDYLANDPYAGQLPGAVLTGLGAVGDLGGAALSTVGAGMSGLIGLGTELMPGQDSADEKKLAEDLTGMAMFAVPELAGVSSVIGKTASITGKIEVPQIGTKQWRNAYGASEAKPSIESLRAAKNLAYDAVDEAGETFDASAMAALRDKVKGELDAGNYVSGVDKQTDAVVSLLDRKAGTEMSLGQLDKLRQEFYKRLAAAPNEVGIRDAIDAIDEMIAGRADTSDLMTAARLSNSRYKKAELLDLAFQKAKDQTDATGSGGNILNKFRQAVVTIIDNPKNAKWFNKDEIATMREFVTGSTGQNAMRLFGKLSPSGNGLMLALNLGAAGGTGGVSMLLTGAAVGAKALADRGAMRGADALIGKVAGGAKKAAAPAKAPPMVVPVPVAPLSGQEAYEPLWERYGR